MLSWLSPLARHRHVKRLFMFIRHADFSHIQQEEFFFPLDEKLLHNFPLQLYQQECFVNVSCMAIW